MKVDIVMGWQRLLRGSAAAVLAVLAIAGAAHATPVPGQGSWESTLLGRDINGHAVAASDASAVFLYDTVLDVTWMRDAHALPQDQWADSMAAAAALNVGGFTGWRLPQLLDTGAAGPNFSFSGTDAGYNVQTLSGGVVYSEMAYLWYVELGNLAYYDTSGNVGQPGWGLSNTGDFQNLLSGQYWLGLQYVTNFNSYGWAFDVTLGLQQFDPHPGDALRAMVLRDGDVLQVPEPSTVLLVLLALAAAAAARRRPLRTQRCSSGR